MPFRAFHGQGPVSPGAPSRSGREGVVRPTDEERRKRREAEIRSFDQRIGEELESMRRSGELSSFPGYGQPLPEIEGWAETPVEFRLAFRILRNANVVPPEVELFHRRAALRKQLAECRTANERNELSARLTELEQAIALRLEALRVTGSL